MRIFITFILITVIHDRVFSQVSKVEFLEALYHNEMISQIEFEKLAASPDDILDKSKILEIFEDAPNVLNFDLRNYNFSFKEQLKNTIITELHNKFFPSDSLRMKVTSKLNDTLFEFYTKIEMVGENYSEEFNEKIKVPDFVTSADLEFIRRNSEIKNFKYFNYILLDRNSKQRLYGLSMNSHPNNLYYLLIDSEDAPTFKYYFQNKLRFRMSGITKYYNHLIDTRFSYKNLSRFIDEGRIKGFKIDLTNQEIIKRIRKYETGLYSSLAVLENGVLDSRSNPFVHIRWGESIYLDYDTTPFQTILDLFTEASNGLFHYDSFKDNIEKVYQKPYSENRIVQISFSFKNKEYRHEWKEKTLPTNSDKGYLEGNNIVAIQLKDMVNLVNKAFSENGIDFNYYLLDGSEYLDTAVLLHKEQFQWINKYFPETFYSDK